MLRGNLKTYRYLDNVWQFVLEPVTLKFAPGRMGSGEELHMPSAKLVCVDSKLIQKEKEERENNERMAEQLHAEANNSVQVKTEPGLELKKEEDV